MGGVHRVIGGLDPSILVNDDVPTQKVASYMAVIVGSASDTCSLPPVGGLTVPFMKHCI